MTSPVDTNKVLMTGENSFRGDRPSTSAVLAWSETWVEPRG